MDFRFTSKQNRIKILPRSTIPDNRLVIRIPHSRVLKLVARSVFLGFVMLTFPWFGSVFGISSHHTSSSSSRGFIPGSFFPMLFRDLTNEGLYKPTDNCVFIQSQSGNFYKQVFINNQHHLGLINEMKSSIVEDTIDLIFLSSDFSEIEFIGRALKTNGVVVVQLSTDISKAFIIPENYKIVYLRQFETTTVVAMRKMGFDGRRRLLAYESQAKKEALDGLEDVLLEPPRRSFVRHYNYLKKTKYLPDLMGDSLDEYTRRVFIDVGGGSTEWFNKNYPTRNQNFKMYKIGMVTEDSSNLDIGVSDWLRRNVKEEEFVVMKAEAEAVEEMMTTKAISLVDELFLECKHQWQKKNKGTRAYWECLALYGRLRDEGIAVHQWWG